MTGDNANASSSIQSTHDPLQIGLRVQMHHHFQSKCLIESLNSHGFCCSYDEVKRYERCASMTEYEIPKNYGPQNFLQYAADNVDHNIRILDGKNTFHGIGIIAAFTPGINVEARIRRTNVTGSKRHILQELELLQRTQAAVQIVSNLPAPSNGGPIYRFWGGMRTRCIAGAAAHKSG